MGMYLRIILNKKLPVKERIKNLIAYFRVRRGANIAWKDMFRQFFEAAPENKRPATAPEEKAHAAYWNYFSRKVNPFTYRVCKNLSGTGDVRYIPEEIYIADIEATLNRDATADFMANKSFYNHRFPSGIFPVDYFHNVDGEYLDAELNTITFEEVEKIAARLSYPVSMKPNRDSYGGKDVCFPADADELVRMARGSRNFVVQEKISQHPFFNRFNDYGLNTIRVSLYRSVTDNRIHVINACMRMGVGGSLDNTSSGGIVCYIRPDGHLNGYAVNKLGFRYLKHPDTQMPFTDQLPDLEQLWTMSRSVAHKAFYARIISLDACYDVYGKWRLVEVNVVGQHTIKFAQNGGQPYFGDFTDEVVNYCKTNHWALTYNPGR